jgi:hypothetical protein
MTILYSRHKVYAINTENKTYLYVHSDHAEFLEKYEFLKRISLPKLSLKGYTTFRFENQFKKNDKKRGIEYNDCLRMAEELTCGIKNYDKEESILKEKYTGRIFGAEDEENENIAKKLTSSTKYKRLINNNAHPDVGETYAIIRKNTEEEENPYHIAHVLFNDDDTNITLEANAGNPDLKYPEFEIYGFKNDGTYKTFYSTYKDIYEDSVVTILVPRDIPENKKNVKTGVLLNKTKKNRSHPLVHASPSSSDDGRKRGRSASPKSEEPVNKRPKSTSPIAHNITHKTRSSSRSSSRSASRTVEMTDLSKPKEGSYNTRSKSPSPAKTSSKSPSPAKTSSKSPSDNWSVFNYMLAFKNKLLNQQN